MGVARDAAGLPVAATSRQAVSWRVAGARPRASPLDRAAGRAMPWALLDAERRARQRDAYAVLLRALALLDQAAPGRAPRLSPAAWINNTASHGETLEMLDRAIEMAGRRQQ